MSSRSRSGERGFSVAELLTVIVIFGLLSAMSTLVIVPLLSQPARQQAKVDTIAAAARAFYRMERDLRMSQRNAIYACTYPTPTVCSTPSTMTGTQVIAIMTPRSNGTGQPQWRSDNGQPLWQGFNVYWIADDGSGTGNKNLYFAFASSAVQPGPPTIGDTTAIDAALTSANPQVVATGVGNLQTYINPNADNQDATVGFEFQATSTDGGHTNETTFQGNVEPRN